MLMLFAFEIINLQHLECDSFDGLFNMNKLRTLYPFILGINLQQLP